MAEGSCKIEKVSEKWIREKAVLHWTGDLWESIGGFPIPEGVQGQAWWDPGQPDVVIGELAHSWGLEVNDLHGPFQPKLLYDYMILWFSDSLLLCFYDYMI